MKLTDYNKIAWGGKGGTAVLPNFIEAHKHSKCPGSYRKGVVFDKSGAICRMFSLKNFVFKTQKIKRRSLFICS
jgi:hypothetical protein